MKKNNSLEEKVMKKIYFLETRKTLMETVIKTLILIVLILNLWIFFDIFFSLLKEQKTFDLLSLLKEDLEVIRRYFFDNLNIFFLEIPKVILAIFLLLILLLFLFILKLKKRCIIIKNKIISLIKFWQKKL